MLLLLLLNIFKGNATLSDIFTLRLFLSFTVVSDIQQCNG